jgi:hypothetical protein
MNFSYIFLIIILIILVVIYIRIEVKTLRTEREAYQRELWNTGATPFIRDLFGFNHVKLEERGTLQDYMNDLVRTGESITGKVLGENVSATLQRDGASYVFFMFVKKKETEEVICAACKLYNDVVKKRKKDVPLLKPDIRVTG